MRTISALLFSIALCACGGSTGSPDDPDAGTGGPDADTSQLVTDPLHDLPTGLEQWTALCARNYGDAVSLAVCAGSAPPVLTSLADLRALLGLTIDPNATGSQPNVRFTLLGHSTALPQRHVSALNPRAFVFTIPNSNNSPNQRFQVLAFARGEAFAELVANDPTANNTLRFFLIRFHPACEQAAGGCDNADLYTPTIESGWTGWSIYDDSDLANTTVDCLQCHQPQGPTTRKMLRMQELDGPWMHWFYEEIPENNAMIDNVYLVARPNEAYAGIPPNLVHPSRPIALQRLLINNGFGTQPNKFDSMVIRAEMQSGASPTWSAIYAHAVAGDQIMVPYFGVPQTDPTKIADAVQAYRDVASGVLPRDQMPDIGDVFLDSAEAAMSHRPAPGLDGRGILQHMCQHCHNSRLDQSLTRARFNVENLDTLAPSIKAEAIRRLGLQDADIFHMPPRRFHTLSPAERDAAIAALQ